MIGWHQMTILSRFKIFKEIIGPKVWTYFLTSLFMGFLLFLIESSFVYVIQGFFLSLKLIGPDQVDLPAWYPREAGYAVGILLVSGVLRACLYIVRQFIAGLVKLNFIRRIREQVVEYSLIHADQLKLSRVLIIYTERINQSATVLQNLSKVLMMSVSATLLFVYGMKIAPYQMLAATVFCMFLIFPIKVLGNIIKVYGDLLRAQSEKTMGIFLTGFKQNFLFKIYNQVFKVINEGKKSLLEHKKLMQKYIFVSSLRAQLPNLVGISVLCGVTIMSLRMETGLKPMEYVSFFYLFIRFAQSLSDINSGFSEIKMQYGSFVQVKEFYEKIKDAKDVINHYENDYKKSSQLTAELNGNKNLSFNLNKVSFGYQDGAPVLSNFDLDVDKGDVLLIKGRTGSGKSTLIKLLTGIENPNGGQINFAGGSLVENLPLLRSQISYVGPEPFIIHGSVKENVLFGNHRDPNSIKDEEIFDLIKFVKLENEVKNLNYQISEMSGLSTGQKQRLSLVRALLRQPNVIILDEATANLDRNTELEIIDNLKSLTKDKILIIVSHKDTFDSLATKSIELDASENEGARI